MKIGLTYDLRADYLAAGYGDEETAEFDSPVTIEAIDKALGQLGYETVRIGHVRALVERLAAGERWDLVFNIAEGLHGVTRETQVPGLLDAYQIPYTFSEPMALTVCQHKGLTKQVARAAGVPTADYFVVEGIEDLARCRLPYPVFAKPVAEGTSKGIDGRSIVRDAGELRHRCETLLARYRQPVLVETYLSGREFTVGIVGTGERARVIGTLEVVLLENAEPGVYSYENKERCEQLVEYRLGRPNDDREVALVEETALAAWRVLGCRDAGRVDVRSDAQGRPCFLETNPLAGLHPNHSDLPILCTMLGIPYEDLIGWIMDSALERAGLERPRARRAAS
ncbi:MAG: hypothetical protein KC466_16745 [Myxococcales bacterium]|nr:hypothetical protein [Myxococcales bacterium]